MNRYLRGDRDLQPGTEIFRVGRDFLLEAYSAGHCQLLLRSHKGPDGRGGTFDTRVDVLFEAVTAMKIRGDYDGLAIRVATSAETTAIRADSPSARFRSSSRVFLLESGGETDYVIGSMVGWHEDTLDGPSFFAGHDPDTPQWARTPLFGSDGGLGGNIATPEQLIRALLDETPVPDRDRYRPVYIVMRRIDLGTGSPKIFPAGVFLTEDEAEKAATRLTTELTSCWIQAVPIAV